MVSFSFSYSLALLSFLTAAVNGVDVDGWRGRTIYQIMTDRFAISTDQEANIKPCKPEIGVHCGGSWKGIREHLDYIQGMDFDAIWISPIVAQMPNWTGDGEAYGGYWQQDLYKINEAFGSEEDLVDLIDDVHKRGMLLMLDIVVNHMVGPQSQNEQFDFSLMRPFNDAKYYHPYCPSGYSDTDLDNLQNCWLGSLEAPLCDLKTESPEVQEMLGQWIENQVWKYGIDGLRIDAAINVPSPFFTGFMEKAGIFATSEVYTQQEKLACEYQETIGSILNYPLYWPMTRAFQSADGNFGELKGMVQQIANECKDPTVLGNFAENHDVARFRNHTADMSRAENIISYLLTADGIPIVMYGQEQHLGGNVEPFFNRQALWEAGFDTNANLYQLLTKLNRFRRHVGRKYEKFLTSLSEAVLVQDHSIAWAKGGEGDPKVISVLNNAGDDSDDFKVEVCDGHGYSSGDELFDIVSCKDVKVNNNCIEAWVSDGHPVLIFKKSELKGSTLCDIEGASDVEVISKAIISTTWTSMVSGTAQVFHSATTMPWSEAPASITSTSSTATGTATSTGSSSGGVSSVRPESTTSLLVLAAIPALIFSGSLAFSLDRFLR